jgi:glutamyl-tRNA reductase
MPRLVMVGVSHHLTPLEVRERLAFDAQRWYARSPRGLPSVLVSTCNRVEVYAWVTGRSAPAVRAVQRGLAEAAGLAMTELQPYLAVFTGPEALLHLVRVAAGLDSLVVGEDQIRGQLRDALRLAESVAVLPTPLRGVFQHATESARRVRGGTRLVQRPSVASAGVHVAQRSIAEGLADKPVAVLGAGVMARVAAESLVAAGARVRLLNRTPGHAEALAAQLAGEVSIGSLDDLPRALEEAVLIVGATASRVPIVEVEAVRRAAARRHGRPLVLLDIAVPRDVEPNVRGLRGVQVFDLDDLERECPLDVTTRRTEIERAEALAAEEAERIAEWVRLRTVGPAIVELRGYAEDIRVAEIRRSSARLKGLTPEQNAAVEALTAGIVNKLLHGPTVALRDAAARPGGLRRSQSRIVRVLRPDRGSAA